MAFYTPTALTRFTRALAEAVNAQLNAIQSGFSLLPSEALFKERRLNYLADTGAADAMVVTFGSPVPTAYVDGMVIDVKPIADSTGGACTINVNGLGVKSVYDWDGNNPAAGMLDTDRVSRLIYAGTAFYIAATTATTTPSASSVTVAMLNSTAYASQAEAEAGSENTKLMTPLRTAQAVATLVTDVTQVNDANGNEALTVTATPSAANHIDITNAATGNDPTLAAAGDDTNINLVLSGKGSGTVNIGALKLTGTLNMNAQDIADANGNELLTFTETASAVNNISASNSATGIPPSITAVGDDTNIDLIISGKGSGIVDMSGGMATEYGISPSLSTNGQIAIDSLTHQLKFRSGGSTRVAGVPDDWIDSLGTTTGVIATSDYIVFYDSSANVHEKITPQDFLGSAVTGGSGLSVAALTASYVMPVVDTGDNMDYMSMSEFVQAMSSSFSQGNYGFSTTSVASYDWDITAQTHTDRVEHTFFFSMDASSAGQLELSFSDDQGASYMTAQAVGPSSAAACFYCMKMWQNISGSRYSWIVIYSAALGSHLDPAVQTFTDVDYIVCEVDTGGIDEIRISCSSGNATFSGVLMDC